jgi:hypothetical protein
LVLAATCTADEPAGLDVRDKGVKGNRFKLYEKQE